VRKLAYFSSVVPQVSYFCLGFFLSCPAPAVNGSPLILTPALKLISHLPAHDQSLQPLLSHAEGLPSARCRPKLPTLGLVLIPALGSKAPCYLPCSHPSNALNPSSHPPSGAKGLPSARYRPPQLSSTLVLTPAIGTGTSLDFG
jgi:hypothetical protein